ncbi:unnamed protein product [Moneuplotes crassus]|uniref:Uncharacterized protein n=1 Tax=Euplotes crassus TaxID=5936 RepID=A0AAD1U6F7_EUPCR|nr:unnamed protein product [Moneuplotes crassus]
MKVSLLDSNQSKNKASNKIIANIKRISRLSKVSRASKKSRSSKVENFNCSSRLSYITLAQEDVFRPKDFKIADKVVAILKQKASKLSKTNTSADPKITAKLSEKMKLLGKIIQNTLRIKKYLNREKNQKLEQEIENLVPNVKKELKLFKKDFAKQIKAIHKLKFQDKEDNTLALNKLTPELKELIKNSLLDRKYKKGMKRGTSRERRDKSCHRKTERYSINISRCPEDEKSEEKDLKSEDTKQVRPKLKIPNFPKEDPKPKSKNLRDSVFTPTKRKIKSPEIKIKNNIPNLKQKMFYPKSSQAEQSLIRDNSKEKLKNKRKTRIRLFSNQDKIKKRISKIKKDQTINQITKNIEKLTNAVKYSKDKRKSKIKNRSSVLSNRRVNSRNRPSKVITPPIAPGKERPYLRTIKERVKTKKISSAEIDFRTRHKNSIRCPFRKQNKKKSINIGNNTFQNNCNLPQLRALSPQANAPQVGLINNAPIVKNPKDTRLFRARIRVKSPEIRIKSPHEMRKKSGFAVPKVSLEKPSRKTRNKFSTSRPLAKIRNAKHCNQRLSKLNNRTIPAKK